MDMVMASSLPATTTRRIVERDVASLKPYARNARTHSKKQIKQIAASIERFGFTNPILVSDEGTIIAGHGRVEAAKLLGMRHVPTLALSHLSETERRAYADCRSARTRNAQRLLRSGRHGRPPFVGASPMPRNAAAVTDRPRR
jgi:ParB-like chromosome segregation protein Spo0J